MDAVKSECKLNEIIWWMSDSEISLSDVIDAIIWNEQMSQLDLIDLANQINDVIARKIKNETKARPEGISDWQKTFSIGYACACANMMRDHGESTMVEDCFGANFMDVKTMKAIGVDESDIEVLRPIVAEIERKQKLGKP